MKIEYKGFGEVVVELNRGGKSQEKQKMTELHLYLALSKESLKTLFYKIISKHYGFKVSVYATIRDWANE